MRKTPLALLICIIFFMLILTACTETKVKGEENNFIDEKAVSHDELVKIMN